MIKRNLRPKNSPFIISIQSELDSQHSHLKDSEYQRGLLEQLRYKWRYSRRDTRFMKKLNSLWKRVFMSNAKNAKNAND